MLGVTLSATVPQEERRTFMWNHIFKRKPKEGVIDIGNAVTGVCLALTPWVFDFAHEVDAAWNAWAVGAAVALIAIGALVAFNQWEEWLNLALGIWAVVAPWVIGFTAITAATYAHVVIGVIVAVLAAAELWLVHGRPMSTA
jgi:hypothetical protein